MNRMGRESRGTSWVLVTALALVMVPSLVTASKAPTQPPAPKPSKPQVMESYSKLPLSFEANDGQARRQVKFLARGQGYTLFLAQNEAVFVLRNSKAEGEAKKNEAGSKFEVRSSMSPDQTKQTKQTEQTKQTVLRMRLEGANPTPRAAGLDKLPGIVNYFIGHDPQKWRTNIPTYQKVEYKNVYSGIDLVYYGNQRQLEYDFVVSPGADPNQIKLAFAGAEEIHLAGTGDLILTTDTGDLRFQKPLVYQRSDQGHKQLIASNYVVLASERAASSYQPSASIGIQLAAYDKGRPLIIDPVLAYSTYLGGRVSDRGEGIAVDAAGSAYVAGQTLSFDFPTTPDAFQPAPGGNFDGFVTKLNPAGSALVYSTFLGGSRSDSALAIALDDAGKAYVTGATGSVDFPTTAGAFQELFRGGGPFGGDDAFVTKLDASGSALVYSTYLGGSDSDFGSGITVGAAGSAYVTGGTLSSNFPTTSGAFDLTRGGTSDAFVTKLNPTGGGSADLVYSTFLGGGTFDQGSGIAVDAGGNAYVTGTTNSSNFPNVPNDFPTTPGAFQPTFRGGSQDAFVTKVNGTGSAFIYSTFLGGRFGESGSGIAVDATGNAYVTGSTGSDDFPTTLGAFQVTSLGTDAFVTKLNTAGSGLVYSTYLGGSSLDFGQGIAVDTAGSAYVTGETSSRNFPKTEDAFQTGFVGFASAFVTKVNTNGSALVYSTYLGESNGEEPVPGVAVDGAGSAYVTGLTRSSNFPTTPGAFQTTFGGSSAFVTKFSFGNTPVGPNVSVPLGDPLGQVTVAFANVSVAGDTTLTTSAAGPSPPAGFKLGDPATYFDLETTATFSGTVTVCINYTGFAFGDEASLKLSHFDDPNWVDATPVSLDTGNDIICGSVNSLSPFAILEPAIQPFAAFTPEVEIKVRPGANNDTFEVEAFFTLGVLSNGINPLTEDMSFKVGSFSTPALSFKQRKGRFKFEGVINGVRLAAKLRPSRRGGFKFEAVGKCVDLDGTMNPVTVELIIGDDRGSAAVAADIESSRQRGKCGDRRDDDKDKKDDKDDDDD